MAAFRKEIEQEIERFLARVLRDQDRGHLDLEAVELALRSSMRQIGGVPIIGLRCCRMSGRWEEFWENRSAKAS